MTQPPSSHLSSLFELEYPQSVGVYDTYPLAQQAVDYLADNKFAVENLAIVGTDLKSVERVTGRKNWGTVLLAGVQSGVSTGLMVALIMWFIQPGANPLSLLPVGLLVGISIGVIFGVLGYAMSRGKRDFTSISQTVATKYEVLCQHKVAADAREMLRQLPGSRAAQFDPRNAQGAYPAPAPAPSYPNQPAGYPSQPGYPAQTPTPGYPAPQAGYPAPGGQPPVGAGQPTPAAPYGPATTAPQGSYPPPAGGYQASPYGSYGQAYDPTSGPGLPTSADDEGGDQGKTPRAES